MIIRPPIAPLLLMAALLALLTSCADRFGPELPIDDPRDGDDPSVPRGLVEVTLSGVGSEAMEATATSFEPRSGAALMNLTPMPGTSPTWTLQLDPLSTGSFTAGERGSGGERYVFATFRVRNAPRAGEAYSTPRENPVFMAVSTSATIAGTAVRRLERFDGSPASESLALEMLPTGAVYHGDGGVRSSGPDVLQIFSEGDLTHLAPPSAVTSVFPYGFTVKNAASPEDRTLPADPAEDSFDGVVTFAFRLPLQDDPADDPYSISVMVVAVDDSRTRLTQSLEEQTQDAREAFEARADALGATHVTLLPGGEFEGGALVRTVCSVRTAGAAGSPTATLVDEADPCGPNTAAVEIVAGADALIEGDETQYLAEVRDADGELRTWPVSWRVSATGPLVIDEDTGEATAQSEDGTVWVIAESLGAEDSLQVTITSDFTARYPASLAGAVLWASADSITGVTDGGDVLEWRDISRNGNHLVAVDPARAPVLGETIANGRPAVRLDHSRLDRAFGDTLELPYSVVTVWRDQGSTDGYLYDGVDSELAAELLIRSERLMRAGMRGYQSGGSMSLFHPLTEWRITIIDYAVDGITVHRDFYSFATEEPLSGSNPLSGLRLGARAELDHFAVADIAEVGVIDRHLTAQEREQLVAHLGAKYALYEDHEADTHIVDLGSLPLGAVGSDLFAYQSMEEDAARMMELEIVDAPGSIHGRRLQASNVGGSLVQYRYMPLPRHLGTVEVFAIVSTDFDADGAEGPGVTVRAYTRDYGVRGHIGYLRHPGEPSVRQINPDLLFTTVAFDWEAGDRIAIRHRMDGTVLRSRFWNWDEEAEPTDWTIERDWAPSDPVEVGWAGIKAGPNDGENSYWEYLSFGLGGAAAPTPDP